MFITKNFNASTNQNTKQLRVFKNTFDYKATCRRFKTSLYILCQDDVKEDILFLVRVRVYLY